MKIYLVGGSVRDTLSGLPVKDRDYVVVGSTPEEMVRLGYRPVGKDFPVFLHPDTHEEYALARTERKVSRGYKGFEIHTSPTVTLEEDLARRDLTINAMARDESGMLIDPFGGKADLEAGILRHASPAFTEDPVRILRTARFAARFGFRIAPETSELMKQIVSDGEVDALIPERVWQELASGLMEHTPSRMFGVLRECGALARILPEIDCLFGVPQPVQHHPETDTGIHTLLVVDYAASQHFSLPVRFAALVHDLGKGTTPPAAWPYHPDHEARGVASVKDVCTRIRVPVECRDLALLAARFHGAIHNIRQASAESIASLLQAVDAWRKPDRFHALLQVCLCDFYGRPGYVDKIYSQGDYFRAALIAASHPDPGSIAASIAESTPDRSSAIRAHIHQARVDAIQDWLKHQ